MLVLPTLGCQSAWGSMPLTGAWRVMLDCYISSAEFVKRILPHGFVDYRKFRAHGVCSLVATPLLDECVAGA